ncbi:MAG TPA: hypothetical protein VIJ14_09515 [Rhabdochlamydiaceae bacterium]
MDPNKLKEGVSVKEIEAFAKKHRFEVFFCLAFIFACFFSFVFFGPGWSIFLAGIGGVLGVIMPARIELLTKKISHFIFKQEKTTQIVLGVVGLVISIILPPVIFLFLGLHGGKSMHHQVMTIHSGHQ